MPRRFGRRKVWLQWTTLCQVELLVLPGPVRGASPFLLTSLLTVQYRPLRCQHVETVLLMKVGSILSSYRSEALITMSSIKLFLVNRWTNNPITLVGLGEECDCGPVGCTTDCCVAATCLLKAGAECEYVECLVLQEVWEDNWLSFQLGRTLLWQHLQLPSQVGYTANALLLPPLSTLLMV